MKESDDFYMGVATIILLPVMMAVFLIVIAVPGFLWMGYVFSTLWAWFVVPIFALPVLTMYQAAGVLITVRAGLVTYTKSEKPDKTEKWKQLYHIFLYPTMSLFVGWLFKIWFL